MVVAAGVETPVDVALVPLAANHRMVDGQWIGEVAVDALATNVVLTAADLLGHTGASSAFDVVAGALDHFQWSTVDSPQYAGVPFDVTITAQDAHGYTIKDFNASLNLSASGRAWDDSSVVISEVDAGSIDAAEFTNVSGRDVDVSGWNVAIYDYFHLAEPRQHIHRARRHDRSGGRRLHVGRVRHRPGRLSQFPHGKRRLLDQQHEDRGAADGRRGAADRFHVGGRRVGLRNHQSVDDSRRSVARRMPSRRPREPTRIGGSETATTTTPAIGSRAPAAWER